MTRFTVVLATGLCTLGALLLVPSQGAQADVGDSFASVATPGCAEAPEWRIGYRFYFRDTAGRTLPRDETVDEAVRAAQEFAGDVGRFSGCGARVSIDLYDEGEAAWPAERGVAALGDQRQPVAPEDAAAFRSAGDYDHGFYRHPAASGCTGSTDLTDAEFPAETGRDCGGDFGTPWSMLLMHEWLHTVVAAHPHVDWPTDDVHGGCDLGYTEVHCLVNPRYFADLMAGSVPEAGRLTGIRPEQWRKPLYPAKLKVLRASVRNGRLDALFSITGRATGSLTLDYQAAGTFTRHSADLGPAQEGEKQVRLSAELDPKQRLKPTGILNVAYSGNRLTQRDALRLRAANTSSLLQYSNVSFAGARLRASGTLDRRLGGVVRLRATYQQGDGSLTEWTGRASVGRGRWSVDEQLPTIAADDPNAYLTVQFTGDIRTRGGPYRGEQDGKSLGSP